MSKIEHIIWWLQEMDPLASYKYVVLSRASNSNAGVEYKDRWMYKSEIYILRVKQRENCRLVSGYQAEGRE